VSNWTHGTLSEADDAGTGGTTDPPSASLNVSAVTVLIFCVLAIFAFYAGSFAVFVLARWLAG
jgi:hypothetical protein